MTEERFLRGKGLKGTLIAVVIFVYVAPMTLAQVGPVGEAISIGRPKYVVSVNQFSVDNPEFAYLGRAFDARLKGMLSQMEGIAIVSPDLEEDVLRNLRNAQSGFYTPIGSGDILLTHTHEIGGSIDVPDGATVYLSGNLEDILKARVVAGFFEQGSVSEVQEVFDSFFNQVLSGLTGEGEIAARSTAELERSMVLPETSLDAFALFTQAGELLLEDGNIEALWISAPEENWKGAENLINQALKLDPSFADALILKGYILERNQELDEASEVFQRALKADPEARIALVRIGMVKLHKADKSGARKIFDEVVETWPDWGEGYFRRGIVWLYSGENYKALEDFYACFNRNPRHVQAAIQIASIQQQRKKMFKVVEVLELASAYVQNDPVVFSQLGFAYEWDGRYDSALIAYEKAIVADPSFAPPYIQLAGIYELKGAQDKTIKLLVLAIDYNPEMPILYYAMAKALKHLGLYKEAVLACKKALSLNPHKELEEEIKELQSLAERKI